LAVEWDVIVVGGGAGGATFAHACARAGKNTLLLERGRKHSPEEASLDERASLIDKRPYDDREVNLNGTSSRLYMGGVLGGGTSLYGAALLRPSRDDFHPGKHYSQHLPRPVWDWPIGYEDLEPHYSEAERLYGVAGHGDADLRPLERPPHGYPKEPLPLHPINERLMAASRAHGLRPFQLPLAIDPELCLRCQACAGHLCPTGARRSSAQLVEEAVADGLPLHVRTQVEVERLELNGHDSCGGVRVIDRATGTTALYRARRYALAAGAIGSPLVLLRSGMDGPLIGRHYMMHLSPIAIGIYSRKIAVAEEFIKQVGFADFYFGARRFPHKLGLVQSLPVPGPLMMAKTAPRLLPRRFLEVLRRRMLPLAGIVEDLPSPDNRVSWGPHGQPRLQHRFSAYDLERGRQLGRVMARILKRAGAAFRLVRRFPSDEHVAHQCGTLRFGPSPDHAVLAPDCRVFGLDNVFVVDGSFLPSSLGVGPALTIMANALRVAAIVTREV
jgi:choline dehydrogenase-like flavoprotein